MKLPQHFDQATIIGVGSFAAAAVLLIGVIVAGITGRGHLAYILIRIAGPICAVAMGILAHLVERSSADAQV